MSRHGYVEGDDYDDNFGAVRWMGTVARTLRGKRGQAFLRELAAAMDAMPEKELVAQELQADGQYCAIGTVGAARGIDMSEIDPDDYDAVAKVFGISATLVREIEYHNDEGTSTEKFDQVEVCGPMKGWNQEHKQWIRVPVPNSAKRRWQNMRKWIADNLKD